ncbi:hypothetical protein CLV92_103226 [Kineococcus xinjiangensis]|uniref:Uncharacterized protein n=1 Tax=Kineococcus xinjiangensis TaxID=512762 RepID=A0A2S6IU44_9ACTN|nr:hypothetical protein [Kineococcus xinjiangensis]PPK97691.1 hypothetical protein CLV92_103226 [Kineococcus xinjiangensis]
MDGYPVVEGDAPEALVLLFVDEDDRLRYLELAPTGEQAHAEFPDPADIRTP